jgi:hypothetical protein
METWTLVDRARRRVRIRLRKFAMSGNGPAPFRLTREYRPGEACPMIRKLQSGEYRLYSRKVNPKTGKRRNLGTFKSRAAAEKHERAVQYFKRH